MNAPLRRGLERSKATASDVAPPNPSPGEIRIARFGTCRGRPWLGIGAALLLGVALLGCAPIPQSVVEFRTSMTGHRRARVENVNIEASASHVLSGLENGLARCVDGHQIIVTGQGTFVTTYRARRLDEGEGSGFAIQTEIGGTVRSRQPPPGGYYLFLLDVASTGRGSIVTITGPAHRAYDEVFEALLRWANGGGPPCPELP